MHPSTLGKLPYIGLEEYNKEHQDIYDCVNEMIAVLQSGRSQEEKLPGIAFILDNAAGFVQGHFVMEEILMQRSGYTEYTSHKDEHEEFLFAIARLRKAIREKSMTGSVEALTTLSNWLHHHIREVDSLLVAHLFRKGMIGEKSATATGQIWHPGNLHHTRQGDQRTSIMS
jgi:hemerythrin-like metal-binding protein